MTRGHVRVPPTEPRDGSADRQLRQATPLNRPHLLKPTLMAGTWLEVRVLPGPPRSPMITDVFRSLTNSSHFAGIFAGSNAGRSVSAAGRGRESVDFAFQSLGSPNPFLTPA